MTAVLATLALDRPKTLPALVQAEILQRIKAGALPGGTRLQEVALARALHVSRSSVREALRKLEEAGLVEARRSRGAFVRDPTEEEASELYEVRGALEEAAARRLARRIAAPQLEELEERVAALGRRARRGTVAEYMLLDIQFHDRLVELAGNATLLALHRRVVDQMHLLRRRGILHAGAANAEHAAIVAALATRDADAAARTVRRHVDNGRKRATGRTR